MQVIDFNTLQQFLREQNVFSRFGVKRVGVFGSFARGEKFNDIDLLVEDRLNYEDRITLKTFLETRLQVPVDIVMRDFAEPIILHRALKDIKYATPS
jgi:predicted nucleotidyltransferase